MSTTTTIRVTQVAPAYIRANIRAQEIKPANLKEHKHRIKIIHTQENIIIEAYAPVSSALLTIREDFYTTLTATI